MHCTPIGLVDFSSDGLDVLINDINDTRREKSPSNKLQGLQKVQILTFGSLAHQISSL